MKTCAASHPIKITETDKGWIELFFNSFRHFIQTSNNPDGDLKKSVLSRFKDLAFDYEVRFQHDNKILNGNRWKYYRNQFLELTVDNGYKGEWTFFCSVFLIIACFAILYFFVFREEVVLAELGDEKTKILGGEDDTKRTERKDALKIANFFKTNKNNQRQYLRWTAIDIGACIMFSGRMFIALKFPLKHFIGQTRAWFVVFLFLQWIIGFIWVYLFFTYIASNYSFIAKLIGF